MNPRTPESGGGGEGRGEAHDTEKAKSRIERK